jgi:peptidyl-prolyl cis-trans isomerase B (cyclophilin B)
VSTNQQRRQAAQRHLQRQLERRSELVRRRRRNLAVIATVVAVAVVVVAGLLLTDALRGKNNDAAATPKGTVACTYSPDTSGNPNLKDVGTPPNPGATPNRGTSKLLMSTDQGDLTLTLDRQKAPCAAASFAYLAQKKFFDGSPCHRLVNQPNFGVLQCGDPTGSGSGGPTYKYGEEVSADTTYPKGTIAMAKSQAPNTTGSQFFLCFVDTELPPQYTVVGTVDAAGLKVLEKVAAGGIKGSGATGDGAPAIPVTITSMAVAG